MDFEKPSGVAALRFEFPTETLDLGDLSRAFRYFDFVWADAAQIGAWLADDVIPPRPAATRPLVTEVRLASPLLIELIDRAVASGGVAYLVRLVLADPGAIFAWTTRVKSAKAQERANLARAEADRLRNEADLEAVRAEVDARRSPERGVANEAAPQIDWGVALSPEPAVLHVVPPAEPAWPGAGAPPQPRRPRPTRVENIETASARMTSDAWHLLEAVGVPTIESVEIVPPRPD